MSERAVRAFRGKAATASRGSASSARGTWIHGDVKTTEERVRRDGKEKRSIKRDREIRANTERQRE